MPCEDHGVCVTTALEVADRICSEKQLKFTKLRQDILRMIWEEHVPQKAYDLLDKLQTTNYSAKPATVYRTLDFLLKNGFIHKVASLNAFVGCSDPSNHEECYFLICDSCNEISEYCDPTISSAIRTITDKNQFMVLNTTLEIAGKCNECAQILD
ncbi:transcriptional repressor [Rhodospirillaceae bacterium]|jgi:Fur family zinc uptake transcriptional regulator|nr:transcriptional repressor [Rhodospirillaceae bacterium]